MDSYLLHSVECENVRSDGYGEFDSVDFALDFSGRSMIAGSVRLEADYEVLKANTALDPDTSNALRGDLVSNAPEIGGHSFCHSWTTSFQKAGLVENLVEYPRYVAMKTAGTMSNNDLLCAEMVAEGRSPHDNIQRKIISPKCPVDLGGGATGVTKDQHRGSSFSQYTQNKASAQVTGNNIVRPDFSLKPLICINNVISQNTLVGYSTSGQIRLSVNLERDNVALYGPGFGNATFTYRLYNMRITFASVPEVPKQPLQLKSHICLKSTINSALANVSSKVPAVCNSVSLSFIRQDREVSNLFKNTELAKLPSVDKVRFMFNDSTNKYISYELKNIPEMIKEGTKAMNSGGGKTMVSEALLNANKGFMLGLDFGTPIDLSNQKFNVQVENSVAIDPHLMFAYYSSILNM